MRNNNTKAVVGANADIVFREWKKVFCASIFFGVLTIGLSYGAYTGDLTTSEWPWKISLVLTIGCCVLASIICIKFRRTDSLVAYGIVGATGIFSLYLFFGIFGFFFFFIFSSMSSSVRWPGLAGGILLTLYWIYVARRNVQWTVENTRFVEQAFEQGECGVIRYNLQRGIRIFEKNFIEPSAFPKPLMCVVYAIAPLYLVLHKILGAFFGTNGILFVIAVLGLPMSLWLIGVLVRVYLINVALPLRIERERNMRVVVEA